MSGAAIILDTETTGINEPQPFQIAFTHPIERLELLGKVNVLCEQRWFKPSKPMELGALATCHVLDEELAGNDPWPGRFELPTGTQYLIGHGVDYDWEVIGKPNVKRICTLALVRKHWPVLDSHRLAALIYHLRPHREARELVRNAHSAATDILLTGIVLEALIEWLEPVASWEHLWEISEYARIPTHFTFGKYGPKDGEKLGRAIAEIKQIDRGYIGWCLSGKCDLVNNDPYLRRALEA